MFIMCEVAFSSIVKPAKKKTKSSASKKSKPRSKEPRFVKVVKGMSVSEILQVHPETLAVFASRDLLCLGDPDQQRMTVQAWALDHGVDVSKFIAKLNSASSKRHKPSRKSSAHKGL